MKSGIPRTSRKYDFIVVEENKPKYFNPVAGFTFAKVDNEPLAIQFIDQSYGATPLASLWTFGNNQFSTDKSPKHTFPAVGAYSINLTVTDQYGKFNNTSSYITVPPVNAPNADFDFSLNEVNPLQVQFIDKSKGEISSWQWSFDDDLGSSTQSPNHLYSNFTTYYVNLTAGNSAGSNTKQKKVVIEDPEIGADFSWENIGDRTIRFTDASTGSVNGWKLEFGDGNVETPTSSGWIIDHQYTQMGIYPARLITYNNLKTSNYSERITVT